jgi:hypothetical protein
VFSGAINQLLNCLRQIGLEALKLIDDFGAAEPESKNNQASAYDHYQGERLISAEFQLLPDPIDNG